MVKAFNVTGDGARVSSDEGAGGGLPAHRNQRNGKALRSPTLANLGLRRLTIIKRYW